MCKAIRQLSILAFCAFHLHASAQTTMYGLTSVGGEYGVGTIYSMTESGTYSKRLDLFRYEGSNPKGDILRGNNGRYYGTTEFGGANGVGTLWEYNPATGVYVVLHDFTTATGARPVRGVILTSNGRLTGTCSEGGANNVGCIWDYNTATSTFTKRADFSGAANGSFPRCRLVQVSATRVFGVTQSGGTNGRGTLYEFNPTNGAITVRHHFAIATGSNPYGGVLLASNNRLYGTTLSGGVNNAGTIYDFNTTTNTHTKLVDLAVATGSNPLGELVQAASGVIYGTTSAGGTNTVGVLFSFTIAGSVYAVEHAFDNAGGYSPFGKLLARSDGFLYGLTNQGGPGGDGTLFSYDPAADAYAVLADLGASGIGEPWGGLMEDGTGVLNGLCYTGGSGQNGALFRFTLATSSLSIAVQFNFSSGSGPNGRMLKHTNGLFYGLTNVGGANNAGVLFSFDPVSTQYVVHKNLGGTDGATPLGTLCESGGKFYGTCRDGGASGLGTIFEFNPATNVFTKKIDLSAVLGQEPRVGFAKGSNGKLYLATGAGGSFGFGTIIEYVPATNAALKVHDFALADGSDAEAELYLAADGNLYGVQSENGQFGGGTLYRFSSSNAFTKLYDFDGIQGGAPMGSVVQAPNGKLYGICSENGLFDPGLIYSWDLVTNTYTEEYPLLTTDGQASQSALIVGTDGNLYGTCVEGGANNLGTVFRFNPSTLAFNVLKSFTGTDGRTPLDGLANETVPASNITVDIEVMLEGPYNSGSGLMNDALRTLVNPNGFPLTEPYTALGFASVGGGGGETVNASVLNTTGNDAIVDWVFVQLRSSSDNTSVQYTRCALVQCDGDVVDVDGTSPLSFNAPAGSYYIAVRHRNHLGTMTASPIALASAPVTVDLTDGSTPTFGVDAQKISGALRLLWAGNVTIDSPGPVQLKYTGTNNDRDPILVAVGGTIPTNTVGGYRSQDVTMDGITKYTGTANDRDPILVNVGGTVPTNTRQEQLP